MSELEDKINGILNNPEQLEMIAKMAQSFMGGKGDGGGKNGTDEHRGNESRGEGEHRRSNDNKDGQEGETLAEMIGSMFGSKKAGDSAGGSSPFGDIDPKMLGLLGKIIGGANSGGGNHGVVTALLPYLSERRRVKLEKAMRIAKMAKVAEAVFAEGGGDLFGL